MIIILKHQEVYGITIEMNHANGATADFSADNNDIASFKSKTKIAGRTGNYGTKNVKIRVPLKYLSNFRRTPEMPLINLKLILF